MQKLTPKAIIFDLGSTLIEYEAIPWDELNRLCAASARKHLIAEGLDVPEESEFHAAFEKAKEGYRRAANESWVEWDVPKVASEYLTTLNVTSAPDVLDRFFDAYYQPVDEVLYVYNDTIATLKLLKQRYQTMGLVSNTVFPERAHRKELQRFGIEPYLDFAIFSSTFGLRKPHPDIFREAARQAGMRPEECVYIGDRYLEDVTGPGSIGMPAILKVHPGRVYPAEMPHDVRKINTLAELVDHIEI